ncbi:unnamed protein product, partial [Vitis vinifera]
MIQNNNQALKDSNKIHICNTQLCRTGMIICDHILCFVVEITIRNIFYCLAFISINLRINDHKIRRIFISVDINYFMVINLFLLELLRPPQTLTSWQHQEPKARMHHTQHNQPNTLSF